jgi:hypothetical protein
MATYECLFFRLGFVAYWENIEAESQAALRAMLEAMILDEGWESVEAWREDVLVFRIMGRLH